MFTPFLHFDGSRTGASGGHGLGLAIVKRITHWHAGRVQIESGSASGGTRIVLVWPQHARGDTGA